jgi:hypothetical protein
MFQTPAMIRISDKVCRTPTAIQNHPLTRS